MIIHPDLLALRSDDAPQRKAQDRMFAAVEAWQAAPQVASLICDLEGFALGGELAEFPALAALFGPDPDIADRFVRDFVNRLTQVLGRQWLANVPFRYYHDEVIGMVQMARSGGTTLSLIALNGEAYAARPAARAVDFPPLGVWERFIAGSGEGDLHSCANTESDRADIVTHSVALEPGVMIARQPRRESLIVRKATGTLISIRLQRRVPELGPMREFDLADGKLVHQSAGSPMESRLELMMALLGRMGWTSAAPVLGDIALEGMTTALRWQALRECLALDSAEGFSALSAIARNSADDLAHAAGALRSQLLEAYPQLGELSTCRG